MSDAPTAAGPIAVTGAAGQTGLAVLSALAARRLATRALVHRPEQEGDVLGAGAAAAAVIDLDVPASLSAAFEGVAAVHHVPPVFDSREPERVANLLAAAAEAEVKRFVLHSVLHPSTPGVRHHERKARSEALLRASGLDWTILRPAMYAQTMRLYLTMSPAGQVIVPYSLDTPFTPIDLADVGAATAVVLAGENHQFATYELAGPEVLTTRQMMELLARADGTKREVRRGLLGELSLPPEWSAEACEDMAAMCRHYDAVGLSGGSQVATMLLGRPPATFAEAIQEPAGVSRR